MLPQSFVTLEAAAVPSLHVHTSSRFGGTRSMLPELTLLQGGPAPPAIDLNRTPAPVDSVQATQKRHQAAPRHRPCLSASCLTKFPPRHRPTRSDPIHHYIRWSAIYNVSSTSILA
jgi:hypothetical protein